MGNKLGGLIGSTTSGPSMGEAPLLAPSMQGDMEKVKGIVDKFLAGQNTSGDTAGGEGEGAKNTQLTEFVNAADSQGNCAIHGAVFGGHEDITKFLVESCGASITICNGMGCSPLWLAAGYGQGEILKYLLSRLEEIKTDNDDESEDAIRKEIMAVNNTGDTALLAAASKGKIESCRILLETAAKLKALEVDTATADSSSSTTSAPANLRQQLLRRKNNGGDTPFAVAIAGGHCITSVDTDEKNDEKDDTDNNNQLFDLLLLDENGECSDLSLSLLNEPNQKGLTPLLVTCERDWPGVCSNLLERGASLDVFDKTGSSPLAVASFCGSQRVVSILLKEKPDLLDYPNETGCTPLWLAARTGNAKLARTLLEAGANLTKANTEGMTPCEAAEKYKKEAVLKVLQEWQERVKEVAT